MTSDNAANGAAVDTTAEEALAGEQPPEAAEETAAATADAESPETPEAAADTPETPETPEPVVEEEEADPAQKMRDELRRLPGEWYVVHSYAGYENKVKTNLEMRTQTLDVEDFIYQIEVPTEEVTEVKNGKRQQVQRKVFPGYILVRMDLIPESYSCVRNTPGVTGFVGATDRADRPSPLSIDEVIKWLAPAVEKEKEKAEV
ncbi:MAG: transcription termination/antitermination NusG family protein, partial [Thermocrispum sp.]